MLKKEKAKRLDGEGTIYYNEVRERWEGQVQYTNNGQKIRKKVVGKTKKDVGEKLKSIREKLEKEYSYSITVAKWLEEWLDVYVSGHVKIKTKERYSLAIHNHIIPYIGDENIRDITSLTVQKFLNMLYIQGGKNNTGLSARTVNSTRTILKAAMKQAIGAGIIDKNPLIFTKPLKSSNSDIYVLSCEECQKLVETAYNESNKSFWIAIVIALETGLRKGEVFGLKWKDIDFDKKCLTVNATVVTGNHGIIVQDSAKTKTSRRTIEITDSLIKKINEYHSWQKEYIEAIGANKNFEGFLITSETGTVKDPNNFTYVAFKRILKRAGLDNKIRFHDLRHTHATQLLKAGVDIKSVSTRLGHSSIRITLDTYAHVLPSMKDNLIRKLDDLSLTGS